MKLNEIIKEVEVAVKLNPELNISEYLDSLKKRKQEADKEAHDLYENKRRWYEALVGRYFMINFNGASFTCFYVDKEFSSNICTDYVVYDIYRGNDEFSIKKEKRPVNKYWMKNPYEDSFTTTSTTIKEISKEEYDDIEKLYQATEALFNTANLD